jgi:hypothetical protein
MNKAHPENEDRLLSEALRLNPICDRFESAWIGGQRPVLEEFLDQSSEGDRPVLLRELLRLEVEYRTKRGERLAVEEYRQRFPCDADLITDFVGGAPSPDTVLPGAEESSRQRIPTDPNRTGPFAAAGLSAACGTQPLAVPFPVIPGHQILGVLGKGGMGIVYKARHLEFNPLVAIKMIRLENERDEEALARFLPEARAVARLQHPNIVQIHEICMNSASPYFSLEFVEGGSLDRKIAASGAQRPRAAAELVRKLALAVQHAHDRRTIHRDLKPANVLLTADGTPKITDFGLAKQLDQESGRTQNGAILGTPSYMAPEQAGGRTRDIGPAADVYALGAILYELLTGRPPFRAATPLDTLLQVVSEEPRPPSRLHPGVARDLETICLTCLQKDPRNRYVSAAALADDLQRFLDFCPIYARPTPVLRRLAKWTMRRPALAALIALCAIGFSVAAVAVVSILMGLDYSFAVPVAVTPGGKTVAANWEAWGLAWSPDGHRLAAAGRNGTVQLWEANQGWQTTLLKGHALSVSSLAFRPPDGQWLASASTDGTIKVWDVNSRRKLFSLKGHEQAVTCVAFSYDG